MVGFEEREGPQRELEDEPSPTKARPLARRSLHHQSLQSLQCTHHHTMASTAFTDEFTLNHGGLCFFVDVDPAFDHQARPISPTSSSPALPGASIQH